MLYSISSRGVVVYICQYMAFTQAGGFAVYLPKKQLQLQVNAQLQRQSCNHVAVFHEHEYVDDNIKLQHHERSVLISAGGGI